MITDLKESTNGGKASEAYADLENQEAAVEISPAVKEKAAHFIDNYVSYLKERTEAYVQRMADRQEGPGAELGGLQSPLGEQYWNLLTIGPIQFIGNPPWRPNRIIAAGELALILGVVWTNPAAFPPPEVMFGGRDYRIRFETINLTTVANGPDATFVGTFPPVPGIHVFPWFFVPGDPGINPALYQTYLTADITNIAQPFAAFSTWNLDLDSEPGFLGLPDQPGGFEHDRPCQYLVYRK